ncbi:MAG: HNH endonuclease [Chlorobi bacterium]|nr:HNH endonuclease [Chlorobiota bacterium]MCI0715033.1 HNH endonuclease [Chlorobiota bacterium]
MARQPNTDVNGNSFSSSVKTNVWEKGSLISGYDASEWRRDKCGRAMKYSEHGNRQHEFGWEIDHIKPVAKGGTDDLSNLQPLYWENNASKGDTYPWNCP